MVAQHEWQVHPHSLNPSTHSINSTIFPYYALNMPSSQNPQPLDMFRNMFLASSTMISMGILNKIQFNSIVIL